MNKETLQSYNTRLTTNNTSLNDILNVVNELPEIVETKLQDKEVTPNKEVQIITSDDGYDGLNQVAINPIPDNYIEPSGTLEITENGTYNVKEYEEVITSIGGSGKYAPRYITFENYTGTELDYELENLDLSNMASLSRLFATCEYITKIKLYGKIDTSILTEYMFSYCSALTHLDLSELYITTKKATNMFSYCANLKYLDVSGIKFSAMTTGNYKYMFYNVPTDCEIIVKDDTERQYLLRNANTSMSLTSTNIKTKAEKEAE